MMETRPVAKITSKVHTPELLAEQRAKWAATPAPEPPLIPEPVPSPKIQVRTRTPRPLPTPAPPKRQRQMPTSRQLDKLLDAGPVDWRSPANQLLVYRWLERDICKITPGEVAVLFRLIDRSFGKGRDHHIATTQMIAEGKPFSRGQARRLLRALESRGLITMQKVDSGDRWRFEVNLRWEAEN
jgi:hypothetical protein